MDTKKFKLTKLTNEIITILVVTIIIGLVNFLVIRFMNHLRWDLTATGEFSLSETTTKI